MELGKAQKSRSQSKKRIASSPLRLRIKRLGKLGSVPGFEVELLDLSEFSKERFKETLRNVQETLKKSPGKLRAKSLEITAKPLALDA